MTTHRLLKAKFDKASGQVFTESFVSAQRSSDRNWSRRILSRPVFTAQDAEDRVQGNRSLRDLALDSIIGNLGHLTLELVEELPKHLNLRIWELASKRYVRVHAACKVGCRMAANLQLVDTKSPCVYGTRSPSRFATRIAFP